MIVGDVYGKESIVVDTHMIRISNRLGIVDTKDPKKIEFELKKLVQHIVMKDTKMNRSQKVKAIITCTYR